ncbi:unnamed protein product [Adineta steineri]|uniref:G-protein coupled receptors family 1 profile domain-containing protein n=1 Tax=Adineta steineri TaxID=433720 RepID=A0A819JBM9_9BILA|nr:unnamed protein product [Adineta steineri]CAF1098121.1 unnamed protein product [Adineta steineri]CAF3915749.1 unnamed protein product [Adineta steineri]CAF3931164.1 unnamed protein product [Adineta steineri]
MGNSSSVNFPLLNQTINRYVPIPLLFFGVIGNILNMFVFTRPTFRNNICVIYFLASTVADSFSLGIGLLTRLLTGFNVDPTQFSSGFCKMRFFITYYSAYSGAWFISLACIERYLCSSENVNKRQFVTTKRAYISIIIILITGFVAFGEQFYCININQQLLGAPQSCYQLKRNIACQIADSLMQFLLEILIPAILMTIFGSLVIRNVRRKRCRINPIIQENICTPAIPLSVTSSLKQQQQPPLVKIRNLSNTESSLLKMQRRAQKRDGQLLVLLIIQVAAFIICSSPVNMYKFYSVATVYSTKSSFRQAIENTAFNVAVQAYFCNNAVKFYIYTLCGPIFRKELAKLFRLH